MLPPGDLRMALAALCGDDEWGRTWARVAAAPVRRRRRDARPRRRQPADRRPLGAARRPRRRPSTGSAGCSAPSGRVLPMALTPIDITAEVRGARSRPTPTRRPTVRGQVEVATTDGRDRRRSQLDPADPPACPEAVDRGPRGRLGGARPGLVVHLGDPAPAGARRCGRRSASTDARLVVVLNLEAEQAGRPAASAPRTTSRCCSSTRRSSRCTRCSPTGAALPTSTSSSRPSATCGAQLVVGDVARGDGTPAPRPGEAGRRVRRASSREGD